MTKHWLWSTIFDYLLICNYSSIQTYLNPFRLNLRIFLLDTQTFYESIYRFNDITYSWLPDILSFLTMIFLNGHILSPHRAAQTNRGVLSVTNWHTTWLGDMRVACAHNRCIPPWSRSHRSQGTWRSRVLPLNHRYNATVDVRQK